eukprot:scaffold6879_cov202-Pinguiococcus_pyrenoidosus.AAC.1
MPGTDDASSEAWTTKGRGPVSAQSFVSRGLPTRCCRHLQSDPPISLAGRCVRLMIDCDTGTRLEAAIRMPTHADLPQRALSESGIVLHRLHLVDQRKSSRKQAAGARAYPSVDCRPPPAAPSCGLSRPR